jgi:hypothetical protein
MWPKLLLYAYVYILFKLRSLGLLVNLLCISSAADSHWKDLNLLSFRKSWSPVYLLIFSLYFVIMFGLLSLGMSIMYAFLVFLLTDIMSDLLFGAMISLSQYTYWFSFLAVQLACVSSSVLYFLQVHTLLLSLDAQFLLLYCVSVHNLLLL